MSSNLFLTKPDFDLRNTLFWKVFCGSERGCQSLSTSAIPSPWGMEGVVKGSLKAWEGVGDGEELHGLGGGQ